MPSGGCYTLSVYSMQLRMYGKMYSNYVLKTVFFCILGFTVSPLYLLSLFYSDFLTIKISFFVLSCMNRICTMCVINK